MRKTALLLVGIFLGCVAIYHVAYAESEAYIAFGKFDILRLKQRYGEAAEWAATDEARQFFADLKRKEREWGRGYYEHHRLAMGPFRRLESETTLPEGRVRLEVEQDIRRGPAELVGISGPANVREHITVEMLDTEDGWKVARFELREEILEELPSRR